MTKQNIFSQKLQFDNTFEDSPKVYGQIVLHQIGDLSYLGGGTTLSHKQYCYEISYCVQGEGTFIIDKKEYPMKKGHIYLSRKGENHDIISSTTNPLRFYYMGFSIMENSHDLDFISYVMDLFINTNYVESYDKFDIGSYFVAIFRELKAFSDCSEAIIKSCLNLILSFTFKNFSTTETNYYSLGKNLSHKESFIYEIVNYIDSNITNISDLSQISQVFGYESSYLSRIFARNLGRSISDYFTEKRFEKARELLISSDLSITEISQKLNYSSVHSFSRAFKNYYGIPPQVQRCVNNDK